MDFLRCYGFSPQTFICLGVGGKESALYFRIGGRGLHFSRGRSRPCFSERFGYTKVWYAFGMRIEWLKP